jgi:hypothetical protein
VSERHAEPCEKAVRIALSILHRGREVFEIRALGERGAIAVGYYDDVPLAAAAVAKLDQRPDVHGIYITVNPLQPACLARAANRYTARAKASTDGDVGPRRWLLLDLDPVRPAGISSTDAELALAAKRAVLVRDALTSRGWPRPVEAMSGNGRHLLYAIEVPSDNDAKRLVERCLAALDFEFSDCAVAVDRSVGNAGRIVRAYGTLARKGDNLPDRPHRRSALLHVPTTIVPVSREQLEALAGRLPTPEHAGASTSSLDVREFIVRHGIAVTREGAWSGGLKYVLRACPFDAAHTGSSAAIMLFASGAVAFRCLHNSCAGREWRDVRALFERRGSARRNGGATDHEADDDGRDSGGFVRAYELASKADEGTTWLLENRIPRGGTAVIAGKPKAGKTTLAASIGLAVSRGGDVLGGRTRKGPVLYVALEGAIDEWGKLLRKLGVRADDEFFFYPGRAPQDAMQWLARSVELYQPVLVIVDPLQRFTRVKESNSYSEISNATDALIDLARKSGAALLFAHHAGKGDKTDAIDAPIGSTAVAGSVDTVFVLRRHAERRTIQSVQRYGGDLAESVLGMDPKTHVVTLVGSKDKADLAETGGAIEQYLKQHAEANPDDPEADEPTIDTNVEGRTKTKREALRVRVAANRIQRVGSGRKGDPYRYTVSCSLVPDYGKEQENEDPESEEKASEIGPNACSRVLDQAPATGTRIRDDGNENQATEVADESFAHANERIRPRADLGPQQAELDL